MFPQTDEVAMKWFPYIGVAIILLVILAVFVKRKKRMKKRQLQQRV